ncbi:calcium/proton exchanger [cf. Phormidesmis sp. LEGE 11477]|uniref:calcium/proton exchanger n=1 Tax=cf. Phormidesmis sp. LEGE 11477 TaxID=1828680 RepID=UPI0018800422|nr:calcium/proton exchanger [cf. Phormidesmis sp. LEGE 11477]MBE9061236.1 calcium/proton exchanger [cf. Phormidesmis sp. LEGE 11477]
MTPRNIIFYGLLAFIPVSIAAHFLGWSDLIIFVTAAIAIIPLAGWMGTATEEIAVVLGPSWGGLMNATFGNATELIIAIFALRAGLINVVKSSITGSIIGNLLLVMGLAMLLGGLKFKEQTFQPTIARLNASSMNLAVIAVLLPTAVDFTSTGIEEPVLQRLSIAVAVVLMLVYGLTLLFSMKTHSYLYDVGMAEEGQDAVANKDTVLIDGNALAKPLSESIAVEQKSTTEHAEAPNLKLWVGVLLAATLAVAVESEFLVGTLEVASSQLGLSELFTGVIILPVIGNAAEHATAVTVALKNKMDLSLNVAVGSSLQIALFVGPLLVIIGAFMGQPMDLDFNNFELLSVVVAVLVANSISADGKSNWLEGTLLLATYTVIALSFYFHPVIEGIG